MLLPLLLVTTLADPATLPPPRYDGYTLAPVDQTARTEMEVGSPRVRRRSMARYDNLSLKWLLTNAEFMTFREWFDGVAEGGAVWFPLAINDGYGLLAVRDVRFVGPWSSSLIPGNYWDVSAKVEVR